MKKLLMSFAVSAACAGALFADVRPASIFTDGAVLQAKRPVSVWGKADPGEKVTVTYGKNKKSAVAGQDGTWRVDLAPMDYVRKGQDLVISGKNKVVFSDVLVGEVWLGIGQSNMEYPFDLCKDGKEISKGGVIPTTVRYFHLPKDGAAPRTFELVEKGDTGTPVEAKIAGKDAVELAVPEGMTRTRVRYAWSADPDVNLVNSAGLPATPFEISL